MDEKVNECTKVLNIYQRISAVMHDVKYVVKEDKRVNGQYTYVSHDAVSRALHMPMVIHGIVMVPTVKDLTQDGNRTVVRMDVTMVNIDNPADMVTVTTYGYGIDPQDKGVGKAVSYAVKNALLKLFCLETGEDVERDVTTDYRQTLTPDDIKAVTKMLGGNAKDIKTLCSKHNVQELHQIYRDNYDDVVAYVKREYYLSPKQSAEILEAIGEDLELLKKICDWKQVQLITDIRAVDYDAVVRSIDKYKKCNGV